MTSERCCSGRDQRVAHENTTGKCLVACKTTLNGARDAKGVMPKATRWKAYRGDVHEADSGS